MRHRSAFACDKLETDVLKDGRTNGPMLWSDEQIHATKTHLKNLFHDFLVSIHIMDAASQFDWPCFI